VENALLQVNSCTKYSSESDICLCQYAMAFAGFKFLVVFILKNDRQFSLSMHNVSESLFNDYRFLRQAEYIDKKI